MCIIATNINTAITTNIIEITNIKYKMSSDDQSDKECPLCMEAFDIDDIKFYPCSCQYQICRFCWHRIRTNENGLCPACRQSYPEDPVNFQPLSHAELQKIKSEKKQKVQQQKNKVIESRKHLAEFRVLQKNLVYAVGLSQRMADPELLKKPEFFGKFGKIIKIAVGTAQALNNFTPPTHTAYVTYARSEDALRAIQAVNNMVVDGRLLKASLGTTKYCSNFLKGQACYKPECMYLHDVAEEEISFTKEDMHQGKHTEYERRLYEQMMAILQQQQPTQSTIGLNNGKDVLVHHKSSSKSKAVTTSDQLKKKRPGSAENLVKVAQQTTQQKSKRGSIFGGAEKVCTTAKDGSGTRELRRNESAKAIVQQYASKREQKASVKSVSPPALYSENQWNENDRDLSENRNNSKEDVIIGNTSPISISFPMEQTTELDSAQLIDRVSMENSNSSKVPDDSSSASSQSFQNLADFNGISLLLSEQLNEAQLESQQNQKITQQEETDLPISSTTSHSLPAVDSSFNFLLDHDDDLGFDPFAESVKALEEIMEAEKQHNFISSTAQPNYSYNNNVDISSMRTTSSNHLFATTSINSNINSRSISMFTDNQIHQSQTTPSSELHQMHQFQMTNNPHPVFHNNHSSIKVNNFNHMATGEAFNSNMFNSDKAQNGGHHGLDYGMGITNSMSDLRESFKALLPSVNVRFLADSDNDSHHQQRLHHQQKMQLSHQHDYGLFDTAVTNTSSSSLPLLPSLQTTNPGTTLETNHFRPFEMDQQQRMAMPLYLQQQNRHLSPINHQYQRNILPQQQNNYGSNDYSSFMAIEAMQQQHQHQPSSSPYSAINSTNSQHLYQQLSNNNGATLTNNQNYYGMLSQLQQQQTQSINNPSTFNTTTENSGWLQVPPGFSPRNEHC